MGEGAGRGAQWLSSRKRRKRTHYSLVPSWLGERCCEGFGGGIFFRFRGCFSFDFAGTYEIV